MGVKYSLLVRPIFIDTTTRNVQPQIFRMWPRLFPLCLVVAFVALAFADSSSKEHNKWADMKISKSTPKNTQWDFPPGFQLPSAKHKGRPPATIRSHIERLIVTFALHARPSILPQYAYAWGGFATTSVSSLSLSLPLHQGPPGTLLLNMLIKNEREHLDRTLPKWAKIIDCWIIGVDDANTDDSEEVIMKVGWLVGGEQWGAHLLRFSRTCFFVFKASNFFFSELLHTHASPPAPPPRCFAPHSTHAATSAPGPHSRQDRQGAL